MKDKLFVLDFDGTLTNIEKSSKRFISNYKESVRADTDFSRKEFNALWGRKLRIMRASGFKYGWEMNGVNIVPANVCPLIESQTLAGELYKDFNFSDDERDKLVFELLKLIAFL